MTAYPGRHWANCALPYGTPNRCRCDTAWIRTKDCSGASCTEMQCLKTAVPLGELNRWDRFYKNVWKLAFLKANKSPRKIASSCFPCLASYLLLSASLQWLQQVLSKRMLLICLLSF
jgi:hypothetical protein